MSSELHKYIENAIDKKKNLFRAEILDFPNNKEIDNSKNSKLKISDHWKINDNANNDQLKAVTGICSIFGVLILIGLFSYLNNL
tara:strand:+ start:119 stop:370 length:252 start_codon:yes stop_codon:yes gene_type:complete